MPGEGKGRRIGGKWFSKEEAERIIERCEKERLVDVARSLGLKYAALTMYVRRKREPKVIEYEKRLREERKAKSPKRNGKARRQQLLKRIESAKGARPLMRRLPPGEYYYVPTEKKAGAYKVRETGSDFDREKFDAGLYFRTEKEAQDYSLLMQIERGNDIENLNINNKRDGN